MKSWWKALPALALINAFGCERPTGLQSDATKELAVPRTANELAADEVARGFALAMNNPALGVAVRTAMRMSEVTEHKLILQEFVGTPAGQNLVTEAASRIHVTPTELVQKISALPTLDFYLPSQSQRRSWRGEAQTRVGYFLNQNASTARAYDNAGRVVPLLERGSSRQATFVLQLAETKNLRVSPQPRVPATVVEDENDGTWGGSEIEYLPNGKTRRTELATVLGTTAKLPSGSKNRVPDPRFFVPCDPDCGGGNTAPPDTTFLEYVILIHVCDNNNCDEGNEMEWHTYFSQDNGSTWTDRHDYTRTGVPSDIEATYHVPALFRKPRYSWERIQSDVVETDAISPDDHFGSPQWYYNENGQLRFEGETRCGWPKYYGGTYNCAEPPLYANWKEVNQSMLWHTP